MTSKFLYANNQNGENMESDKRKEEKEYSIYCIYNKGKPFILSVYKTFSDARNKLLEMIQLEEDRHRTYYVDNDFFENKYTLGSQEKYFSIIERTVSQWERYAEDKNNIKNKTNDKNKILAFTKYG